MFAPELLTFTEISQEIAARAREVRLRRRLTQQGLAERAGVSLGSLKRFEHTGQIALHSLIKIAFALDALDGFADLFARREISRLDDLLAAQEPAPKRGSRR